LITSPRERKKMGACRIRRGRGTSDSMLRIAKGGGKGEKNIRSMRGKGNPCPGVPAKSDCGTKEVHRRSSIREEKKAFPVSAITSAIVWKSLYAEGRYAQKSNSRLNTQPQPAEGETSLTDSGKKKKKNSSNRKRKRPFSTSEGGEKERAGI